MKNLITPTAIFLTALILTFSGVSYFKTQPSVGIALPQAVGVFETSLQTGITSTATSMTLTANSIRGGGSLSGFNCFTVDEGSTNAEVICGTVASTAVTGLTRGISYEDGETEVAGNKYSHRRGANIKITDFPIIQRLKAQNNGDSTFVNYLLYDSYSAPTTDNQIISKKYVDDTVIAGGVDGGFTTKGIYEQATQIEMASSTGAIGSQKALTALYATSTPTVRGLYLPVAENDGYLSQLWLDLTENFAFSGTNTFSGENTFSATTTMATSTNSSITVTGTGNLIGDGSALTGVPFTLEDILLSSASDTLVASNDSVGTTGSTSYVKVKTTLIRVGGGIRVKFSMKSRNGDTVTGRIYVNDVAIGTEQSQTSTSYIEYSQDITIKPFDSVQIYTKVGGGGNDSYISDFRIYFDTTATDTLYSI